MLWIKKVDPMTGVEEAVTRTKVGKAFDTKRLRGELPFSTSNTNFADKVCRWLNGLSGLASKKSPEMTPYFEVVEVV